MASANPARVAGVGDRKGVIAPGFDADLVLLDGQLNVRMTMVMGEVVWTA
jgi:N-acetylglucosamine-6-phosphate deacetylase